MKNAKKMNKKYKSPAEETFNVTGIVPGAKSIGVLVIIFGGIPELVTGLSFI